MSLWFFILIQITILAYAFVGGVFLAFSDFIMRSLTNTSGAGGVEAMQVINREVFRWVFMTLFLGLVPASLVVVGFTFTHSGGPAATLMLLAGLTYLIGCFGVTIFFSVPMNEALAGMDLSVSVTQDYWTQTYVPHWKFWNTVRTLACAVSAALLLCSLALPESS
jgi:uncharacterized membrane protein